MLPPLIQRPRPSAAKRSRERGVTLALVAVALFSIIAMAGLSIDLGTLYQASAEAQRAADAGALAAARVLSYSGLTGDPENSVGTWAVTCTTATQAAQAVANQNNVAGAAPSSVTVTFFATDGSGCTSNGPGLAFGVNPMVTVVVQKLNLPTYFSRIWGRIGSSVSARATAEAFNPSGSGSYASGGLVPVQPRCVKPWVVPNLDPLHPINCTNNCTSFVDKTSGQINNPGILPGVVGERFWLYPDCTNNTSAPCTLIGQPQANTPNGNALQYVPGQVPTLSSAFTAIPACSASANPYAQAIAGCDQSTSYQCGQKANFVDLSENPGISDTTSGVQCLIHEANPATISGQDLLAPGVPGPPTYPFQIQAGASNPLGVSGSVITSSNSIVSLPIYDSSPPNTINAVGTTQVTIVGFLQVFINAVDAAGEVDVTVINVAGCGNAVPAGTPYLYGSSPVPVRLITPP